MEWQRCVAPSLDTIPLWFNLFAWGTCFSENGSADDMLNAIWTLQKYLAFKKNGSWTLEIYTKLVSESTSFSKLFLIAKSELS